MAVTIHEAGAPAPVAQQAPAAFAAPAAAPAPPPAAAPAAAQPAPGARPGTETRYCVDARGRQIGWRRLNALEDFDLTEIAGDASSNEAWMIRATCAFGVREIDGERVQRPLNKQHLRAMIARLDDEGMTAVLQMLMPPAADADGDAAVPGEDPAAAARAAEQARAKN